MKQPSAPGITCRAFLLVLAVGTGAAAGAAQEPPVPLCGAGVHVGETEGFVALPTGDVFCPLVADPKADLSFLSFARGEFPSLSDPENETEVGTVGLSEALPLARWAGARIGDGVQVSLSGGVFAQFDLASSSFDLINSDFLVGLPITARFSGFSLRLRPYHQSSHLGDEFLLREEDLERENLSFESLELILSQEARGLRVYGGGEYLFRREPEVLEELVAHGGIELRLGAVRGARFLAAVDVKSSEEQGWDPGVSARAGLEVGIWREPGHPPRLWRLLAEFYDGPSPYGQFFQDQIRSLGIGLQVSH